MKTKNDTQKVDEVVSVQETNLSELMAIDGGMMKIPGKIYQRPLVDAAGDPISVYLDGIRVSHF